MAGVEPQGEISAFNAGVRAVLDLASRAAASIDAITVLKPTRFNFAAETGSMAARRCSRATGRGSLRGCFRTAPALLRRSDHDETSRSEIREDHLPDELDGACRGRARHDVQKP